MFDFILKQSRGLKRWGVLSAGLTVAGVAISYLFPLASRFIIDEIIPRKEIGKMILISLGVIILYTVNGCLAFFSSYLSRLFRERMIQRIRHILFDAILRANFSQLEELNVNDLASRLIRDVYQVQSVMLDTWILILKEILIVVAGLFLLLRLHYLLLCVALPAASLIFFIAHAKSRRIAPLVKHIQEETGKLTELILTPLYNLMFIKIYKLEDYMNSRLRKGSERLLGKTILLGRERILAGQTAQLVYSLAGVALFLFCGLLIMKGSMTLGTLVAAGYINSLILSGVQALAGFQIDVTAAKTSFQRIDDILGLQLESRDSNPVHVGAYDISIRDLEFSYPASPPVLKGMDLEVREGERVAIVGASGSGKSTLMKLLLKLYQYSKGSILVGGTDIRNLGHDFIREKVAYIPQRNILFTMTMYENILLGKPNADRKEVERAARLARLDEVVGNLEKGWMAEVSGTSLNMSGGEIQRIGIARAFLKDSPIIILDESTSQLDAENEKAIRDVLQRLFRNRTVLIIAHRLSTIVECDRIYVMEDGRVLDSGTHAELCVKCSYYRKLCEIQFISGDLSAVEKTGVCEG